MAMFVDVVAQSNWRDIRSRQDDLTPSVFTKFPKRIVQKMGIYSNKIKGAWPHRTVQSDCVYGPRQVGIR